jgi:hypothetical protein
VAAVPRAVNYAFHVWMVSQSGSATITKYTPVTFSTLVYHMTSYTWDDHGFLPGTYQYTCYRWTPGQGIGRLEYVGANRPAS